ncbi:MAG: peptidoglycan-binding protein [Cyanobacteria bacterium SBLK]|nr:peptidoglycan-binding protein [Cyanobacteria bacterium SBLK]
MKKIFAFSQKSQTIAQTAIEEQGLEVKPSHFSSPKNNDLGLFFLSISIFLFLGFLLFKRKSKEVRLSIFVSFFLGCLLAVYTSIQISTQSLIGKQEEKENNELERKPIASQVNPTQSRNREENKIDKVKETSKANNKNSQENSSQEIEEKSQKTSLEETGRTTEKKEKVKDSDNTKVESGVNSQKNLAEKKQNKTDTKNSNISRSSISPNPNLTQFPEQQESEIATSTQNNVANTTGRGNLGTTNPINSIASTRFSRDRSFSANVQTSLFRPILKLGDRGFDVTLLQTVLKELGYYALDIDGDYGYSTELAVQNFQQQNNLLADGIVGFSTCNILKAKSENTEIQCTS